MTEKLYYENSHLFEFSAKVLYCRKGEKNFEVILDKTAFFPEGGGQPSDIGTLDKANVLDVQIIGEDIVHYTDGALEEGSIVTGVLDRERRLDFMRQHSGEHIVCGIAHKLYGCENVGFHLSEETVTLDLDKYLSKEEIEIVEKAANDAVLKNLRFKAFFPKKEELGNLNYRSKMEIEEQLRLVEIEEVDLCACCAPHVSRSGEIGIIKLVGSERLRGGIRIYMKSAKRALEDYNIKHENSLKIGEMLCVKPQETADAVSKVADNLSQVSFQNRLLIKRLCDMVVASTCEQLVFTDDFDIKELQIIADGLHKKTGKIHAVFCGEENKYAFCFCGNQEPLAELFSRFKQTLSAKGGGRNGMMSGTVNATREQIEDFFEKQ